MCRHLLLALLGLLAWSPAPGHAIDVPIRGAQMNHHIEDTRRQLGELAAMAAQTEAMERKIMARAEALLADIEGKIKSEWAAGIANDKAQLRYTDMLEERGRLLQVIAQARQVQAL